MQVCGASSFRKHTNKLTTKCLVIAQSGLDVSVPTVHGRVVDLAYFVGYADLLAPWVLVHNFSHTIRIILFKPRSLEPHIATIDTVTQTIVFRLHV